MQEDAMNENVVITNCYKISKDEFGIIHREILKDAHITVEEAKKGEEIAVAMNGVGKMLALIEASQFHTMAPEAMEYLKESQYVNRIATAIVSNNLSERINVDYIGMNRKNNAKIFPSKEEAIKWLLAQKH